MPKSPGGSPKARNLGAELRKVRERVNVSTRTLAQKLDVARSRLLRWESGTTVPKPAEVASYLALLGVNGADRDRLVELADDVDAANWITSDVSGVRTELTTLIEFERTCISITDVSPLLIPGLLQTARYVRSVMTGLRVEDVDRRVGIRLGRQDILIQRKNAPKYSAFISESALRQPIGGPDIMAEQLHRIAALVERPNITVQVISSEVQVVHPAHAGPFALFRFPKASPIVHLEHLGSAAFVYGAKEVAVYERAEEILRHAAMSADDSEKLIAEIANGMERIGE
jgi:transcriptional regulator with XRE-family HTH domain